MLVVSACLAGVRCRYDGQCKTDPLVQALVAQGRALPVCPEQLGGLSTPRVPAEIAPCAEGQAVNGGDVLAGRARVLDKAGRDVTEEFTRGAEETLALARLIGAEEAVLKEGSPSCGSSRIYDGTFSGRFVPGPGVTASLLKKAGIRVRNEEGVWL